jgi:hypothetical protein
MFPFQQERHPVSPLKPLSASFPFDEKMSVSTGNTSLAKYFLKRF